jgi:hypothetical protein
MVALDQQVRLHPEVVDTELDDVSTLYRTKNLTGL